MIRIREAREGDIGDIREIFRAVYGNDYPHHEVYDELWLKKSVFNDDAIILVAEDTEHQRVVGTASVMLDFGAHSDLVGEFGRLAVQPDYRRQQVGRLLMEARLAAIGDRLHLGLVVARTVHPFAQRISLAHGFVPVGFLPQKHLFQTRESFALIARYFGDALALRRNNPRIIPEVHPLADRVMRNAGIEPDVIVDDESTSYPLGADCRLETLHAEGYTALVRIERGRVRRREVFGPMRLEYGFFKLAARQTRYLLAKQGEQLMGAIGLAFDPAERTARVFELIASTDQVIRFLLAEMDRHCIQHLGAEYIEIDVSAHAPRMQRTLLELGYQPVAYVPAMVFHEVERLDIVKMVHLAALGDLGPLALEPPVRVLADIVMGGFTASMVAPRLARAISDVALFAGMNEEQALRLAAVCRVRQFAPGDRLFAEAEPAEALHVILEGQVAITSGEEPRRIGTLGRGDTVGEASLLATRPHSATATAEMPVETADLTGRDLEALIRRRPDIGVIMYRNLALGLGDKLVRADHLPRHHDGLPLL